MSRMKRSLRMASKYAMNDPNEPDTSYGDFYCNLCVAHMHTIQMWEAHIQGKRHQKNLKKHPSEPPSKVKSFRADHLKPLLDDVLREQEERGPLVGLDYIAEQRRVTLPPLYFCSLCAANHLTEGIIEHIFSLKHRSNYLKKTRLATHEKMERLQMSTHAVERFVNFECELLEESEGPGKVEVRLEKEKFPLVRPHLSRSSASQSYDSEGGACGGIDPDMLPSADKGITELDLFGDNLSMDIVIDIIYDRIMKGPPPPTETPEQIQRLWNMIQLLETAVANYEIRQLSKEDQQKLLHKVMYVDKSKRPLVKLIGLEGLK